MLTCHLVEVKDPFKNLDILQNTQMTNRIFKCNRYSIYFFVIVSVIIWPLVYGIDTMACKKFLILAISTFLLTLIGCTYNPFVPNNELTGNATSTAVGAGVGGGLAWLASASKGVIAATTLGGAALGYYISTLTFASAGLRRGCGQVFTLGCYTTIDIPSDVLFDVNSADFLEDVCPILDSVVSVLQRYPNHNIIISGNTSGFGSTKFERRLSEARARKVAGYLWMHGISDFKNQNLEMRKLTYVGYGNYFPIANNIRNRGIRQNSHIQITAYPTEAQLNIQKLAYTFNNIGAMSSEVNCSDYNVDNAFQTFSEERAAKQGGFNESFTAFSR